MYSDKYGFSEIERKIIQSQIERRAKYRQEFLKLRTDPCKHSKEAGFVLDPAMQRFLSMKTTQLDYFKSTPKTGLKAFVMVLLPMFTYGCVVWTQRMKVECDRRCGRVRYKDRLFKLC